jgi:hypothetical protein
MSAGPARTVKCRSCGQRVGAGWGRSSLMLLLAWGPFLAFHLLRLVLGAATPQWAYLVTIVAMVIGCVATFVLYVRYVSLVKR